MNAPRSVLPHLVAAIALCALLIGAAPWPESSKTPVTALERPSLEARADTLGLDPRQGFGFVVFGDQRALADGEWQALLAHIARLARIEPRILFLLDTGDLVEDGSRTDQFAVLREILEPVSDFPYLACAGNHEVDNNRSAAARANLATFLSGVDPSLASDRLYYRKDVGEARFYFLDTNDFIYGETGKAKPHDELPAGGRARRQLEWLASELAGDDRPASALTVAVVHHPFLQSSSKHRDQARALWSLRHEGRQMIDLLLDGGVDVVFTGHTHTYERFRVRRQDGRELVVVNLSGRPRSRFLFFGARQRRAARIEGEATSWLASKRWQDLERFSVIQEDAMTEDEANQFAYVSLGPDGALSMELFFLRENGGVAKQEAVRLR